MVKDKAVHVNSYEMERNGKKVFVPEHNRQAKGVTKEFPVKVEAHDLTRNGKTVHIPEHRRRAKNSD